MEISSPLVNIFTQLRQLGHDQKLLHEQLIAGINCVVAKMLTEGSTLIIHLAFMRS